MPPSSTNLLPGPHDPYNASSVKLAEATRIRLVLPGLGSDKDNSSSSVVKRSNTGDLSGKPAESAAALAKARKKLLKIQGIASQADKAHSSVIVDAGVLAGESAAADEEPSAAEGRNQGNSSSSSAAAGRNGEAAGSQDRRSSKQGAAGGSATAGAGAAGSQQLKSRKAAAGGESVRFSGRLALPSPSASAAADASADSTAGSSGSRSAASSSRSKGQQAAEKPYVPIWERLLPPSAPAEERKAAAATHRVYQPVALKTFSPTLGSLGSSLAQQEAGRLPDEAAITMTARVAGSRPVRSAAKSQGQPPDSMAAGAASAQWRQGDGGRITSKQSSSAANDLALRSQSFTSGYQSPSQLFEKLTLGGPPS